MNCFVLDLIWGCSDTQVDSQLLSCCINMWSGVLFLARLTHDFVYVCTLSTPSLLFTNIKFFPYIDLKLTFTSLLEYIHAIQFHAVNYNPKQFFLTKSRAISGVLQGSILGPPCLSSTSIHVVCLTFPLQLQTNLVTLYVPNLWWSAHTLSISSRSRQLIFIISILSVCLPMTTYPLAVSILCTEKQSWLPICDNDSVDSWIPQLYCLLK